MSAKTQIEQWTYKNMRATVTAGNGGNVTVKIERSSKDGWSQIFLSTSTRTWGDAIRGAQDLMNSSVD